MKLDHLLVFRPALIERRLARLRQLGLCPEPPNVWQLWLGQVRMWFRVAFRSDDIGLDPNATMRRTIRARVLSFRPVRGVFLFGGRRVNPLDHTGLGSSNEHIIRHVVGAFHPAANADYDLQILAAEGELDKLADELRSVVDGTHPRAAFLRDLCVYEGYHEAVLATVEEWLARGGTDDPDHQARHPDDTLAGFLAWCARQPATPRQTVRAVVDGSLAAALREVEA